MISINEAKRKLPIDFIENIYELYDPLKVDQILQGMMNPRNTTIRVNTIKYNIQDLMRYFKEKNIKFERVLWYSDALIINWKYMKKDIYIYKVCPVWCHH